MQAAVVKAFQRIYHFAARRDLARRLVPRHPVARVPDRPVGLPGAAGGAEAGPGRADRHLPWRHRAVPGRSAADQRPRAGGHHRRRRRAEPPAAPAADLPDRPADGHRHRRHRARAHRRVGPGPVRPRRRDHQGRGARRARELRAARTRGLGGGRRAHASRGSRPTRCASFSAPPPTSRSTPAASATSSPRTRRRVAAPRRRSRAPPATQPRPPPSTSTRPLLRSGRWTRWSSTASAPQVVLVLQAFEPQSVLRRHQDRRAGCGAAGRRARARACGSSWSSRARQHPRRGAGVAGRDRARGRPARRRRLAPAEHADGAGRTAATRATTSGWRRTGPPRGR